MAILWDDELPLCDGVSVDLLCLAEVAMLADWVRRLRANLRRLWWALGAGLVGTARAVGG